MEQMPERPNFFRGVMWGMVGTAVLGAITVLLQVYG